MRGCLRLVTRALLVVTPACESHTVDVELPASGRALSRAEQSELQRVAESTFRDARKVLRGLPPRLTLIVRWGKDVIAETGENGTAGFPGNIGWTLDPDRDALEIIHKQLRPSLFHELHHLARARELVFASTKEIIALAKIP